MQPTFNPLIQAAITSYSKDPVHALLIVGPRGSGKGYIVDQIVSSMVKKYITIEKYNIVPEQDKKNISIDQIKLLQSSLRTKIPNHTMVIIKDADILTVESQNSLLKLLEEPPSKVHFILTTSFSNNILITIKSRVNMWQYISPSKDQLLNYIKSCNQSQNSESLLALSGGRMGLLSALLKDNENHPLRHAIEEAKELLSEPSAKRVIRVDQLAKDSVKTATLLDALLLVCIAATKKSISKGAIFNKWLLRSEYTQEAIIQNNAKVQPKLLLTRLFLVL